MKISETIELMTKAYLHRVIDSFTKDFPKPDEVHAREIILRNADELSDRSRIETMLRFDGVYSDQVLLGYILEALINSVDYAASETEIIEGVTRLERQVIDAAASPDSLRYADEKAVEVFKAVMEVALEDDRVTQEEIGLIRRLREKLRLSEPAERIILAQMNHFPRSGNNPHSPGDFHDALIDLQRRGVVFYCNKADGGKYMIPEEIVPSVRRALGVELSRQAWGKLLAVLGNAQLSTILENQGIPKSGTKAELQDRVMLSGVKPSTALDYLTNQDLYEICWSLPGAKVSGSKQERAERIIDYFANLVARDVAEEAPEGERYYRYLVELAARDRENLLANQVIRKDRDMESAFEEGTRFLFQEKLGLQLRHMQGSDHPDGCIEFGKRSELLMWDNKSKETIYTFPPSHLKQFKRYIRDSDRRVSCFLIVAPQIADEAAQSAAILKVQSGSDTDVALISAEDLLWVAEEWRKRTTRQSFNPEVLNTTGILTRPLIEQRMKLFL